MTQGLPNNQKVNWDCPLFIDIEVECENQSEYGCLDEKEGREQAKRSMRLSFDYEKDDACLYGGSYKQWTRKAGCADAGYDLDVREDIAPFRVTYVNARGYEGGNDQSCRVSLAMRVDKPN